MSSLYVLRSWEQEFPRLGATKTPGAPRIYRRADVDLALRIKHLVFAEGLTLSGARRRIDAERAPELPGLPEGGALDGETRQKLAAIKNDLRALHAMLSDSPRARRGKSQVSQPELPELNAEPSGTWPAPRAEAAANAPQAAAKIKKRASEAHSVIRKTGKSG